MNKKILAIALGGAAVWYFFLRKKTAPATMLPAASVVKSSVPNLAPVVPVVPVQETVVVAPEEFKAYVYPAGLQEGDYVKFGTAADVYLLNNGKKLPITKTWWDANAWDQWGRVKFAQPVDGLNIPTGPVL
jgi:hypothetical protein